MYKISVLIGIYNCASTLKDALDSLYTQTYKDFKVIMCDDGSTDDTYAVAKSYAEKYDNIILIRNTKNMGLNYTLNHCIEYADTKYCARMDGDDISLPTRFEKQVQFLDSHPEYAVVSTPMIYFDDYGEFRRGKGKGIVKAHDFINGSPICHAPSMIRTDAMKAVGGYSVDNKLLRVEDYHLWFKMFAAGYKLYMMDECLYMMRDDQNAFHRRTLKSRLNEAYVKSIGFRMIGLPIYYQIYALRPILIGLLPKSIYTWLHKRK